MLPMLAIVLSEGCRGMAVGGSRVEEFPRKVVPECELH